MTTHTEMRTIALLPLNLFPLPGELVSIHISEDAQKRLLEEVLSGKENTFGLYYNHYMNIHDFGTEVKVMGVGREYPGGDKDIWVKTVSVFFLKSADHTQDDKSYTKADIEEPVLWEKCYFGESIKKEFTDFIKNSEGEQVYKVYNRRDTFHVYEIMKLMQLNDIEKFYALNLAEKQNMFLFLINSLRFRNATYRQKQAISGAWCLN